MVRDRRSRAGEPRVYAFWAGVRAPVPPSVQRRSPRLGRHRPGAGIPTCHSPATFLLAGRVPWRAPVDGLHEDLRPCALCSGRAMLNAPAAPSGGQPLSRGDAGMATGSMTWLEGVSRSAHPDRRDVVGGGRAPYVLCGMMAAIVALAAGSTVAFPSLLLGVAVSNGNLRGTAVALLAVGLPVLIVAMIGTRRGSARSFVVWLGTMGYLDLSGGPVVFRDPVEQPLPALRHLSRPGRVEHGDPCCGPRTSNAFAARLSDAFRRRRRRRGARRRHAERGCLAVEDHSCGAQFPPDLGARRHGLGRQPGLRAGPGDLASPAGDRRGGVLATQEVGGC